MVAALAAVGLARPAGAAGGSGAAVQRTLLAGQAEAGVRVGPPQRISVDSPFSGPCTAADPNFSPGISVETSVAVNPTAADHVLVSWIQDGAATDLVMASRDGGRTFSRIFVPGLSQCTGGSAQAASDPSVAFAADGQTAYFAGVGADILGVNPFRPSVTMLASRSIDDGFSWSAPSVIQPGEGRYWDKPILTVHPRRPNVAYYTYALRRPPAYNSGYSLLSTTADGGRTWSAPRTLYDPGTASSWPANSAVLVNRDGSLVDVFVEASGQGGTGPAQIMAARSSDGGRRWGRPIVVGRTSGFPPSDPVSQNLLETIGAIPSQTVAPNGDVYVAWADPGADRQASRIAMARSTDGGRTWTAAPLLVRGQSALPAIAVAGDGTIGLLHYVIAPQSRGNAWPARVALATTRHFGHGWRDQAVAGPFNLLTARSRLRGCCSLGDYIGLAAQPHGFIAAYPMAKPIARHSIDVYVSRATSS